MKNRKRETCTSGTVRDEGGNILIYSANDRGIEETSASFEARSAPRSYPTIADVEPDRLSGPLCAISQSPPGRKSDSIEPLHKVCSQEGTWNDASSLPCSVARRLRGRFLRTPSSRKSRTSMSASPVI